MLIPTDPPTVAAHGDLIAEVRRYTCPDRTLIVLTAGPYTVADFTSVDRLARAVDLATVTIREA